MNRNSSGGYQVISYTSAAAVAVHTYCAQNSIVNKIEWPHKVSSIGRQCIKIYYI
jgi:hypothetical protein